MRERFRELRRGKVFLVAALVAVVGIAIYWASVPEVVFPDPAAVDVSAPVPGFDGRAAIAVLPFANASGDPEQDDFADGIAEDILTGLQAWRTFPVISRNSSFLYRDHAIDVARELGVGYVLEGSVRRLGDKVRITAQLTDARTGNHVWAERYDRRMADVFEVQDQIALNIVNAIAPGVVRSQGARVTRVTRARTQDMRAYDYLLRARGLMRLGTFEDDRAARELLLKALERDHRYSPAYAKLAWIEHRLSTDYRSKVTDARAGQALRRALDYAKTAVERDPALSAARGAYGHMLIHFQEKDLAVGQGEEAVRLNPSDAAAHAELGLTLCVLKKYDESIAATSAAKRLSPRDPGMWRFLSLESCALMGLKRYDGAIRTLRRSQELRPNDRFAYVYEIFALQGAGRTNEAQTRLNALRVRFPDLTLKDLRPSAMGEVLLAEGSVEAMAALDWEAEED
jgi:TolB-like protein/Flp pilus assembly protein TadD